MLKWDDKKLTILISSKQLIVGVFVAILLALGLTGLYVRQKVKAAKEQILKQYHKSGSDLRYELSENPAISENKSKISRYWRGFKILKNNTFDGDVIAYDFKVDDCNEIGHVVVIKYVDELLNVAQISYTQSIDPNVVGGLFLAPDSMPPPNMRMFGKTELCVLLRVDSKLSANDGPYDEWDDERWYLVVPQATFEGIVNMEGQFILLGKEGNVLDRFRLKELCNAIEQTGSP
ncbi:MAG: hypothetical protein OEW48_00540 [Phycisphaerae bacterium]|nr:hypothetical protein [Phycisphaerae bacterium]